MRSDLPGILRAARRQADLSQRELAKLAGVGAATVARLEMGSGTTATVAVLDRMLEAAGCRLLVVDAAGAAVHPLPGGPRDRGGRRYPAHLDVRRVVDGWGWWFTGYMTTFGPYPDFSFDLARHKRDCRRRMGEQALNGEAASEAASPCGP